VARERVQITGHRRHAAITGRPSLAVACGLALAACASLPKTEPPVLPALADHPIELVGAKGPLSARQAAAIFRRLKLEAPDADALKRHLAIEQAVAGSPLYTGNRSRILQDGAQTFPAMFDAIRAASRSIHLEYYTFEDIECDGTRLSELLTSKRAAGVEVAVIYDSIGSNTTPAAFLESLREAGVQLLAFNPVNPLKAHRHWSINDRDHRKMLVADDRIAIVGGINLAATYQSTRPHAGEASATLPKAQTLYWRDTDIEIVGPAVAELDKLFRDHWAQQGGPALVDIDMPPGSEPQGTETIHVIGSTPGTFAPRYYATVLSAINTAERRIWITAAYFVPTRQERAALRAAARRGVDVRLLVPSYSDSPAALAVQHSSYSDLCGAGVKIYERDGVVLHSKSIVVDSVWSVIGSSNLDHRSVLFNDEVDAVVLGNATAKEFERVFLSDLAAAHAIDPVTWGQRPPMERLRELFWKAWATLL
jgi:cardiolipin synthase